MKNFIIVLIIIILIGFSAYFLTRGTPQNLDVLPAQKAPTGLVGTIDLTPSASSTSPIAPSPKGETVIGQSVLGNAITAYHYGTGSKEILFVGGIHGGYSWNTALVAYDLTDYLKANPDVIPATVRVSVIPVLNPDGLSKVVGTAGRFTKSDVPVELAARIPGRFNENKVDLNRNFDCDWQASAKWQNTTVSGGTKAFSEPESLAIRNYVEMSKPVAVVVWYSAAGGVFASSCRDGVLPETLALTNLYAKASGYSAHEDFDFYETTGDMVNWLAKQKIPAISVLLSTHEEVEWNKNRAGIEALLQHYGK